MTFSLRYNTVVNPDVAEVRSIMENVTDTLIEIPEGTERSALLAKCAEDFGADAALELDRWSKLKPQTDDADRTEYDPGHPWHYYNKGDDADPPPIHAIPARPTTLELLGVKLPKNPAKRRELFGKMLVDQKWQLAEDEVRYRQLIDRGTDALSRYDREIAHGGNDELAWASAIALKYNHISIARGRVCILQQVLPMPLGGLAN